MAKSIFSKSARIAHKSLDAAVASAEGAAVAAKSTAKVIKKTAKVFAAHVDHIVVDVDKTMSQGLARLEKATGIPPQIKTHEQIELWCSLPVSIQKQLRKEFKNAQKARAQEVAEALRKLA